MNSPHLVGASPLLILFLLRGFFFFFKLMVHKAGGKVGATEAVLADCIEAARLRYGEMAKKLRALAEEDEQPTSTAAAAGRQAGGAPGAAS